MAVPTCPSNNAVIVAVPASSPVACPIVPGSLLIVETDAGDDVHKTKVVRSWVCPSTNAPIARKATPACGSMPTADGVICIEMSGVESTTIVASAVSVPSCALMLAVPATFAVTFPPLLTLATLGANEVQVTRLVITCVLPSLKVPIATQFTKVAGASTAFAGLMEIEESVAELTCSGAEAVTPVKVAEMLAVPGPTAVAMLPALSVATA